MVEAVGKYECSHELREYINIFQSEDLIISFDGNTDQRIGHITFDTRDMKPGTLFFCKGVHFKPEYLSEAAQNGAVAYVSEVKYSGVDLPCIIVNDIRHSMSLAALFHFDRATEKLTTVGITGTKGKSTVAYYVKAILDHILPRECAIMSTIDNYDGVTKEESNLTTQEAIPLQSHAYRAYKSGLTHLVLEASSQALKYERVYGIRFDVACLNNIGTDHISPSEHPDFDDYFASKLKIFDNCKVACVNTDADHADEMYDYAKAKGAAVITYGSHSSDDVYGYAVEKRDDGIFFTVRTKMFEKRMCITMPGLFNVSNALAAIAICSALGVSGDDMAAGLKNARVSGRMEPFDSADKRTTVIVDYAHNKLSYEALYKSVKEEYKGRKIITVFGCPGVKALNRRKDLGELAGQNSDFVVITEEDSGDEPFEHIAEDISQYVKATDCPYVIIENRGEAIKEAVLNYGTDKVVLITGKGRETTQRRGTVLYTTPSDADYGQMYLAEFDKAAELAKV